MDERFNQDFLSSEYEYQAYQMAPHKRTTVDMSFDKEGNRRTEEERMEAMYKHSLSSEKRLAEETFGSEGGTSGWEGVSE
jgi:hypothetical protein